MLPSDQSLADRALARDEQAGAVQPSKQVHKQLKILDDSLKMLATNVSSLGLEMVSVLNEVAENEAEDKEKEKVKLTVPLANEIRNFRERCDQIASNVENLRHRLEV